MLHPHHILAPRLAGRLACGELAVEPVLGMVRVAGVQLAGDGDCFGDEPVFVRWRDEHGPGMAAGRYRGCVSFPVVMPSLADRLLVRRGIDQAVWHGRVATDDIARLIACHLHTGPRSAVHRFAVDGSVAERVYDELEVAARHRRYARDWVAALTRYCLAREDTGPLPQWTRREDGEAEARAEEWLQAAGVDVEALVRPGDHGNDQCRRYRDLLARKRMPTDMAARLIEAAFLLGVAAARKRGCRGNGAAVQATGGGARARRPGALP